MLAKDYVENPVLAAEEEKDYQVARKNADIEFNNAVDGYRQVVLLDPTQKFQDYMDRFEGVYNDACEKRDKALEKLSGSDLRRAKGIINSAQARLVLRKG
jgi:hypothetical protein